MIAWRKSSHSESGSGCVEVGWPEAAEVAVRDSKQTDGPTLSFPMTSWNTFLSTAE